MDSRRLSERLRQPGHDQTYRRSERDFVAALSAILPLEVYEVVIILRNFGPSSQRLTTLVVRLAWYPRRPSLTSAPDA